MDSVQLKNQETAPAFLLDECKKYLKEISNIRERNVIVYYSGWLKNNVAEASINENDKNALMNAVCGLTEKAKVLILSYIRQVAILRLQKELLTI